MFGLSQSPQVLHLVTDHEKGKNKVEMIFIGTR